MRQDHTPRGRAGFGWALAAAATFGTSGTFGSSLIHTGWSPGAAVTARISIAALVLMIPAALALRAIPGRWHLLRRNIGMITMYGLIAIAGCQVFYFNAVQNLSVGVALLLEYMGIVLVVGWLWLRSGQRPGRLTIAGSMAALLGLGLVLDLVADTRIDIVGVLWGLGAAVGLAVFFVVSAKSDPELPPLVLAGAGMTVGALILLALGAIGILPMTATTSDVDLAGRQVSWWIPILGLSVIAAAFAYVAGISAARLLGSKLSSFVGLLEVLFAVLFAWFLLGQLPSLIQAVGGVLIIGGVALVRLDELRVSEPLAAARTVPVDARDAPGCITRTPTT